MPEFKREMLQFPHSKHDDQADSVSQFLTWARDKDFGPNQLIVHGFAVYASGDTIEF